MNLPYQIAKTYFGNYLVSFSKDKRGKRFNAIQVLTLISIVTAIIISAAAVIILSVFNGLTLLLGSLNEVFYPDLKIEPAQGKVFSINKEQLNQLQQIQGIEGISEVVEEIALLEHNGYQIMAKVKGVDSLYAQVSDIEEGMFRGDFILQTPESNYAVLGLGLTNQLNLHYRDPLSVLTVYIPQRKKRFQLSPTGALGRVDIRVSGEFSIQQEFDNQYAFMPLTVLRPLLQYDDEVSYLELKLSPQAKPKQIRQDVRAILGDNIAIKNREQQNESWYKVMRFEKWMSFAILILIMLIASFNLLSSLTMMVLDKQKDIGILKSMGLTDQQSGAIFRWQGLMIGLVGALIGGGLASILVLLQQQFGFIPLRGSFVVDSYPIQLKLFDLVVTIFSVILISYLASIYPSLKVSQQQISESI